MKHSFICESSRIITLDKKETNLQYYIKLQQIKINILSFQNWKQNKCVSVLNNNNKKKTKKKSTQNMRQREKVY